MTSAGLIKASDGKLTSLSPLSGHYRAGTMHFKAFVRGLEEEGVDMSSVSISKSVRLPSLPSVLPFFECQNSVARSMGHRS